MIFYFTGTGNSWYAAMKVRESEEAMINMTDCLRKKEFDFHVEKGEAVGFAFPVYFGGLPAVVQAFLSRLQLTGSVTYTYGLLTCGSWTMNAGGMLKEKLAASGIHLDAVFSVVMPENYAIMFSTPDEKERDEIIDKADKKLLQIADQIRDGEETKTEGNTLEAFLTNLMYPFYRKGRKTKHFYADDRCVGCNTCAKRCPVGAIKLKPDQNGDMRPVWIKERCVMCMACVRCNAVQYKKNMLKRTRYVNPAFKKQSSCH